MIGSILTSVISVVPNLIGYFKDSPAIKAQKEQNKIDLLMAEADLKKAKMQAEATATAEYDLEAIKSKSKTFMDEILAIVHTSPMWLPGIEPLLSGEFTAAGAAIMENMINAPYEWWLIYAGIIASTFGLRWLFSKQRVDTMIEGKK